MPRKQRLDGRLVADGEAEGVGQRGFQCLHEAAGGGVVKLVGGFVQIEDVRAGDEDAGEAQALLFAAGEAVTPGVFAVELVLQLGKADLFQRAFEDGVVNAVARRVAEVGAQGVVRQVGALRQA